MMILNIIYYGLFRVFKKDNSVKTVIICIQSTVAVFLFICIRKKLGLDNIFFGKENDIYSTLVIIFFAITFGIFNNLYYSEKRVKSILKKYGDNEKFNL